MYTSYIVGTAAEDIHRGQAVYTDRTGRLRCRRVKGCKLVGVAASDALSWDEVRVIPEMTR